MASRYITDFDDELVTTSKSALIELVRVLNPYKDALTLIGGWVPFLLLERFQENHDPFRHVGSIDIDWVIDPNQIDPSQYSSIRTLLEDSDWKSGTKSEFMYEKEFKGRDKSKITITTDFLTPRPADVSKKKRHTEIQPGLKGRNLDSAILAVDHHLTETLQGELPNGADTEVSFRMLDIVGCVGTKSFALEDRYKHKDSYDIVSVLFHCGKGPKEAGSLFKSFLKEEIVSQSLDILNKKYSRVNSEGPVLYADFVQGGEGLGTPQDKQTAFQVVNEFLNKVRGNE